MKFTCEKTPLANALSIASRTVCPRNPVSALEGIFLQVGADLQLTGYNLETGITVKVPAQISDGGSCILPARLFFDIIRKLPNETVSIQINDNYKVSVKSGISSFSVMATAADDYPQLPDVNYVNGVKIPQNALRELISGTIFSVSENQAKPIHTGCLMEIDDTCISMVAVDGFRLARRCWHSSDPIGRTMKFVVPAAALKEVEKILGDTDEPAVITRDTKHIMFEIGGATLVCRILEGDFMDWHRVVPTANPILLTANVAELSDCIERVSLIVSEKIKSPVRCKFSENSAEFRTVSANGDAYDVCALAGDGKELEIGFNCRYLLDALRAVPAQEVTLELSNGLSPVVLTPCTAETDFIYMVLPVRLKAGE